MDEEDNSEQNGENACPQQEKSPTKNNDEEYTIQEFESDDEEPFQNPTRQELLAQGKKLLTGIQKRWMKKQTLTQYS